MDTMTTKKPRTRSNQSRMMRVVYALKAAEDNARHFKWTCDQYINARTEARKQMDGMTMYEVGYIDGVSRILFDDIWRYTTWRLGTADGPMPEGSKWDYMKGSPSHGGHFWTGTDKPFTAYTAI